MTETRLTLKEPGKCLGNSNDFVISDESRLRLHPENGGTSEELPPIHSIRSQIVRCNSKSPSEKNKLVIRNAMANTNKIDVRPSLQALEKPLHRQFKCFSDSDDLVIPDKPLLRFHPGNSGSIKINPFSRQPGCKILLGNDWLLQKSSFPYPKANYVAFTWSLLLWHLCAETAHLTLPKRVFRIV